MLHWRLYERLPDLADDACLISPVWALAAHTYRALGFGTAASQLFGPAGYVLDHFTQLSNKCRDFTTHEV